MKVKIGKYPSRLTCCIHTRYMENKYGFVDWPTEYTRFEKFLEKTEDAIQFVYNLINVRFLDESKQKCKVHIDPWDTWSMDHTLAPIILPMLVQLKATKHGAPRVDFKDVPRHLWPTKEQEQHYDRTGNVDDYWFDRWDWVLREMIYAFDCKANKDDVLMRFDSKDKSAMEEEQNRISNGFRLFGKYYESLWD